WLARYENGWNKLKTDLLNSTATVNYYRAYTNAFSYFAIVGEKAQAAQAPAPVVEPVNENPAQQKSVNEETPKEQLTPSEPEKSKPSYVGYVIAILVIIVGVWVARSKVLHKAMKETIKEQPAPVVKNIFTKPKISRKVNSSKTKDLDDIQRRIDGIKRKSRK
ncbi:PGF-pre-PGF domain-containing protein, partial [archaeon]|nr:PGF-pre-PGF domain-containing protein [Nanoarchaeota archaeon]MBU4300941.1 PGF-pre-PGF domain-containing protein [Nanoarchaeota archaeon]MBU4452255.1 PGF-pre-PGF domain-containing protein [Nanoarchaeota archaeon]MCG2724525.1 PGF-pre-PGF domain-containing protein [archaeon]